MMEPYTTRPLPPGTEMPQRRSSEPTQALTGMRGGNTAMQPGMAPTQMYAPAPPQQPTQFAPAPQPRRRPRRARAMRR